MTCRAATGFVSHSPTFSVPAPSGYAECRRCLRLLDLAGWMTESCPGTPAADPPAGARDPVCALCGAPIVVDPMHRATVELFGSTCSQCFDLEAAHV